MNDNKLVQDINASLPDGVKAIGVASAGTQVFFSRELRLISLWRAGENYALIVPFSDHPSYNARHPDLAAPFPDGGKRMIHLGDIPEDAAYQAVFFRLDFPYHPNPKARDPFSPEILSRVQSGEYYSTPLTPGGAARLHAGGLANPTMTALFSIDGPDGSVSVVVIVHPSGSEE